MYMHYYLNNIVREYDIYDVFPQMIHDDNTFVSDMIREYRDIDIFFDDDFDIDHCICDQQIDVLRYKVLIYLYPGWRVCNVEKNKLVIDDDLYETRMVSRIRKRGILFSEYTTDSESEEELMFRIIM